MVASGGKIPTFPSATARTAAPARGARPRPAERGAAPNSRIGLFHRRPLHLRRCILLQMLLEKLQFLHGTGAVGRTGGAATVGLLSSLRQPSRKGPWTRSRRNASWVLMVVQAVPGLLLMVVLPNLHLHHHCHSTHSTQCSTTNHRPIRLEIHRISNLFLTSWCPINPHLDTILLVEQAN